MKVLIFDLYHTLLEVDAPPANREERWRALWADVEAGTPRLSAQAFLDACAERVVVERTRAQVAGVPFPEVVWPRIVDSVLPELATLGAHHPLRRAAHGSSLLNRVRLAPGASEVLALAVRSGRLLGLASNCQAYSLEDFAGALEGHSLSLESFAPDLRALSYELGFAKPDPHLFRLLTVRVLARGMEPSDVMMIGDREDNDLRPARAAGWDAFRIIPRDAASWRKLGERIADGSS
jgi:FMN phosphatase YigB (HAD superfamily)